MRSLNTIAACLLLPGFMILSGCSRDADTPENRLSDAIQEPHSQSSMTEPGQSTPAVPADTSRLALDWAGTYSGTVPCASCPGIETVVTLHDDGTYLRSLHYIGESPIPEVETGTFSWNDAGSSITLDSDAGASHQYQVGEHRLFHLDMQGQRIEGDLADHYILHQHLQDPAIEDTRWELIELNGKPIEPGDYQTQPFLVMQSETSRINGNASCNTFSGAYTIKSNQRIDFGDNLALTRMACPDMKLEQAFMELLAVAETYAVDYDGSVTLNRGRMTPLARFIKADEPE